MTSGGNSNRIEKASSVIGDWLSNRKQRVCIKGYDSNKSESESESEWSSWITRMRGYAVLEANGKVNGIGEISHPSPSQTLGPIWMPLQIYHYVPPGSRCAKFY